MYLPIERIVRVSSWLACAAVVAMVGVFFATGVGQDPLQFVHAPEDYARLLLKNPPALRVCLAFDNAFIVFYASMFVALGMLLLRRGAPRLLVGVAVTALLLLALLDMAENFHFMVMLSCAERGAPPPAWEIGAQVFESLLKFHVSYLGLFLLGFALPRDTAPSRVLANLSWFLQLPVGILIYVTPPALSFALVLVRFLYFLTALALVGAVFGSRRASAGSDAPASRPGTTPAVAG